MMITESQLEDCINAWHDVQTASPLENEHLRPERIYELAVPGEILSAPAKEINHLSVCASCMSDWAFWSRVHTEDPGELENDMPVTISGGMLKAAASPGEREALKLKSTCGRFLLGILPEVATPERGLITLEAITDAREIYNGKTASVRDAKNRNILSGVIENNRIARRCEDFQGIDLSSWTLVIES